MTRSTLSCHRCSNRLGFSSTDEPAAGLCNRHGQIPTAGDRDRGERDYPVARRLRVDNARKTRDVSDLSLPVPTAHLAQKLNDVLLSVDARAITTRRLDTQALTVALACARVEFSRRQDTARPRGNWAGFAFFVGSR